MWLVPIPQTEFLEAHYASALSESRHVLVNASMQVVRSDGHDTARVVPNAFAIGDVAQFVDPHLEVLS